MTQEYPTLQGVEPSWADITCSFPIYGGETVVTPLFAAIKWSDKVDIGVVRGASGGRKLKRTTGLVDNESTFTFYRSGWREFRGKLAEKDKRISLVGFDLIIQHTPPGESAIYTVKIVGCRVAGRSMDMSESADADKVEVPFNTMRIEEDGVTLL